jgi:hypothetical protein
LSHAPLLTWGNGDPVIPADIQAAHDAAAARGDRTYRDPRSGGVVVTSVNLLNVGFCCGNGCRHCPYPASEQRQAGRERIRPATRDVQADPTTRLT